MGVPDLSKGLCRILAFVFFMDFTYINQLHVCAYSESAYPQEANDKLFQPCETQ